MAARAELNALLAYPPSAAPTLADSLEGHPLPTLDVVTQQALAANAELAVLQKRVDEARARRRSLARCVTPIRRYRER